MSLISNKISKIPSVKRIPFGDIKVGDMLYRIIDDYFESYQIIKIDIKGGLKIIHYKTNLGYLQILTINQDHIFDSFILTLRRLFVAYKPSTEDIKEYSKILNNGFLN